jgi:hypothetical protein
LSKLRVRWSVRADPDDVFPGDGVVNYRDTASALAQHSPGNLIGVALYVPMNGQPARWGAVALMNLDALRDWYEELAGSPTLYYYLAVFDKGYSTGPLVEAIAPPKPGMPGFDMRSQWRRPAWPVIDRVSGLHGRRGRGRGRY